MNSWTCWTSGLALSKETMENQSLDSLTKEQRSSPMSSSTLHLVQKESGLFDNDLAGPYDYDPASFDDQTTDVDVINLGSDGTAGLEKLGGDVLDIFDAFAAPVPASDEAYLNSFLDLSVFLEDSLPGVKSEELEPCHDQGPVSVEADSESKRGQKRKFDEDNVHVDIVDEENMARLPIAASTDHDYVSKKPRTSDVKESKEDKVKESTDPRTSAEKYRDRRVKNNVASKRSREIRKQKFASMEAQAEGLVIENDKLREKIAELEKLTKEMKATLIQKMVGKTE